jgi:hypothetical protein
MNPMPYCQAPNRLGEALEGHLTHLTISLKRIRFNAPRR